MSDFENSLRSELRDPEYSEGYAESFLNAYIATQIKVIREQRRMTQAELGTLIGTTQAGVSRYENVNYSSWNIKSLIKMARAFKIRLKVTFEPFGTLPNEVSQFNRRGLERVERENDPGLFLEENPKLVDIGLYRAYSAGHNANSVPEDSSSVEDWSGAVWK